MTAVSHTLTAVHTARTGLQYTGQYDTCLSNSVLWMLLWIQKSGMWPIKTAGWPLTTVEEELTKQRSAFCSAWSSPGPSVSQYLVELCHPVYNVPSMQYLSIWQPMSPGDTTLLAHHIRPLGFLCGWHIGLEFTSWQRSCCWQGQFLTYCEMCFCLPSTNPRRALQVSQ